jgi:hypothetical protein
MEAGQKECGRCLFQLSLNAFHKREASKDGLQNWCKACHHEHDAERRKLGPSKCPLKTSKGKHYNRYVDAEEALLARRWYEVEDLPTLLVCPYCHCYHFLYPTDEVLQALRGPLGDSYDYSRGEGHLVYKKKYPYEQASCENIACICRQ